MTDHEIAHILITALHARIDGRDKTNEELEAEAWVWRHAGEPGLAEIVLAARR